MTLLLPLLMLGVAVAADQPQPAGGDQRPVVSTIKTGTTPALAIRRPFTMSQSENPFVSGDHAAKSVSTSSQDDPRKAETCFTMRSYFFEREDDQGMQFLGMTKCDPGRAVTQKHVRGVPRLIPAN